MRILYAIDSLGSGGAQRQLVELACALARREDTDVEVVTYHPAAFFGAKLREHGVPVTVIPRRSRSDMKFLWHLRGHLRERRPDVIHSFLLMPSFWTFLASRTLGRATPIVAAERSDPAVRTGAPRAIQRKLYARCDAVTANSAAAREALTMSMGIPTERVFQIPNGIDVDAWTARGREECPLPLAKNRINIALIGGLRREKNHHVLLDALPSLLEETARPFHVWCIGGETGGPKAATAVREKIARLGLEQQVTLAAPVTNVAAVLSRLDVLVLPSTHEGFPNAVLEAMAMAVPVIASRVGEVPTLIEPGVSGVLLDETSADVLGAALRRVLAMDPEERSAMGRRGQERVRVRYGLAQVAEQYLECYRQVVDGATKGRRQAWAGRTESAATGETSRTSARS